jgi:hypothetical protein
MTSSSKNLHETDVILSFKLFTIILLSEARGSVESSSQKCKAAKEEVDKADQADWTNALLFVKTQDKRAESLTIGEG